MAVFAKYGASSRQTNVLALISCVGRDFAILKMRRALVLFSCE